LAFVIQKEKRFVLPYGATESASELTTAVSVKGRGSQQRPGISAFVTEISVDRSVHVIGAGFRDHINDAAQRASVLGAEAVVHNAKFVDCFLRRRGALRARRFVNVVGTVHGHGISQIAHSTKRNARGLLLRERGLQAGSASRN